MMKANTQRLYELTVNAHEVFINKHPDIRISIGLMENALRKKGIAADAVTIDNLVNKNRVILTILDHQPNVVGIGVGNTLAEGINFIGQHNIDRLLISDIIKTLEDNLNN